MLINFLSRVLPQSGHWFVVHISQDGKTSAISVPAGDLDEVQKLIRRGNANKQNTYYGVCSFVAPEGEALKRNRACAVNGLFRTLRIDIDVGEGKNYQTFDDAVAAVDNVVDNCGLPKPLLVSSGRGLHVYFPFRSDANYATWYDMSSRLRAAVLREGLKFDDNITEPERLLRLPTSVNQRSGAECGVFDEGDDSPLDVLQGILTPFATSAPVPAFLKDYAADAELEGGMEYPPYSAERAVDTCPALIAMVNTGGAGVPEPLWKRVLDLVAGGDDTIEVKEELALVLSDGHRSYSESETLAKLRQSLRQKYPPMRCDAMGRPECATCPFSATVTSPAILGRESFFAPPPPPLQLGPSQPATLKPAVGQAPDTISLIDNPCFILPYLPKFQVTNGLLRQKKKVDDQWQWVDVAPMYRFVRGHRERTPGANGGNGMKVHVAAVDFTGTKLVEPVELYFRGCDIAKRDIMEGAMGGAGLIIPDTKDRALIGEFFMGFMQTLQQTGVTRTKYDFIGWDNDGNFAFGDTVLRRGSTPLKMEPPVGPMKSGEVPVYSTAGDPAVQVGALNDMLATDASHLVLALAVATPMMRYTAFKGAAVSLYSKSSGVGKTALLKAVASIWGNPDGAMIPASSTAAAIQNLIGVGRSVPIVIDEVSLLKDEFISQLLYDVSQGQGKRRMQSGGTALQAQTTEWQTLLFVTTNITLADRARGERGDSDAQLARLLEIHMETLPPGLTTNPDTVLSNNFGHFGRSVIGILQQGTDEYWRELVASKIKEWGNTLGLDALTGPDRFRLALCAIADIAAIIARSLGVNIDSEASARAVKEVCVRMARESSALVVNNEEILRRFVNEHYSKFGRTVIQANGTRVPVDAASKDYSCGEVILTSRPNGTLVVTDLTLTAHRVMQFVKANKYDETDFRTWLSRCSMTEELKLHHFMRGTVYGYVIDGIRVDPALVGWNELKSVPAEPVDNRRPAKYS
jgi:hypothetical protein